MSEAKQRITEGTASICKAKGFAPRPSNDMDGDVGVCLIYQMPDAESAQAVAAALRAENVSAGTMFKPDVEDWHVYYHWGPIMEKRTANRLGCPWTCPYYQGQAIYDRDACPTTLGLLSRSMHIDISPTLSEQDADSAAEVIGVQLSLIESPYLDIWKPSVSLGPRFGCGPSLPCSRGQEGRVGFEGALDREVDWLEGGQLIEARNDCVVGR